MKACSCLIVYAVDGCVPDCVLAGRASDVALLLGHHQMRTGHILDSLLVHESEGNTNHVAWEAGLATDYLQT